MRAAAVEADQAGLRLDRFLAASFADLSRSRLQALIDEGAVFRAGATIRDGNTRVKPGEIYEVRVP
ncbi:S4 domain-containing protein, partial [Hyphomicrobium sp.]|uniref:S4 domain-containing protein n=1 Tax=Hyphomicrobium sp. TaxID=82 RepID=UPI002D1AEA10